MSNVVGDFVGEDVGEGGVGGSEAEDAGEDEDFTAVFMGEEVRD